MIDDMGFSDIGPYWGEIKMPNFRDGENSVIFITHPVAVTPGVSLLTGIKDGKMRLSNIQAG